MEQQNGATLLLEVPPKNNYALASATLASMTSILLGYNISVMSGAQIFIKDDLDITDTQIEVLCGIINVYSLIGSFAAGWTLDHLGRRGSIVLTAAIFFIGAVVLSLACNYATLMVGRFISGIGIGYVLVIAPIYTAEIAPASIRGRLSSLPEIFINSGVLLGYIANYAFASFSVNLNWRLMFAAGSIPPIFLAIGVLAMPESPRWLVVKGKYTEAHRILTLISNTPDEADRRLHDIKESLMPPTQTGETASTAVTNGNARGVWTELLIKPTPATRRILIAVLGVQFFQQASGVASITVYSPRVFKAAGITSNTVVLAATIIVGVSKTAFTLVATFLTDRIGRRPLLLASAIGMAILLVVLATILEVINDKNKSWVAGAACVVVVAATMGVFSIGLGPLPAVYFSEVLPLRLRAQGVSLGIGVNRVMNAMVGMTFISLYKGIGMAGCFYLYAGFATAGSVFFYVCLPETKGRSLEDMEVLFGKSQLLV